VQTFFGHGNSCNHVTFNAKVFPPPTPRVRFLLFLLNILIWRNAQKNTYPIYPTYFLIFLTFTQGDTLASSDADGVVKLWDVRTVSEKLTIDLGPFPANHVSFDPSATFLVVPSDSHIIKVYVFLSPGFDLGDFFFFFFFCYLFF
jgi:WD40 repeat protein